MMEEGSGGSAKRWIVIALLAGAGLFALMGGTYTTLDLIKLKGQLKDEQDAIAQLKGDIDSLTKVANAAEHDPRTQEQLARDQYGMIRSGEYLYRIVPGDTTAQR